LLFVLTVGALASCSRPGTPIGPSHRPPFAFFATRTSRPEASTTSATTRPCRRRGRQPRCSGAFNLG